ncbi:flagellar protein FlaG [Phenylobacterium sp. J367]|uniref:flagellar protein FlaG n=1 Tax=Phenylobacterium sp. J367 TaxID=2898435 RepID=UPI002150BB7A|nr:flagellar protein FlaG [Phenylobacterium sp. J367]MCR5880031.1 flagellar protein FlaG [Phenylobacterium sp. J367]
MQSKVAPYAATPDPTFGRHTSQNPEQGRTGEPGGASEDQADLRLIIEEDQATGAYVYKTIDRRTGEVILQLQREEVLKMREASEYVAGVVIRTSA